jgi:hypothetical protein
MKTFLLLTLYGYFLHRIRVTLTFYWCNVHVSTCVHFLLFRNFLRGGTPCFFGGTLFFFCWGGRPSFLLIAYLIDIRIMFWDGGPRIFIYYYMPVLSLWGGYIYIIFFVFILFTNKEWFSFQCVCNAFNIKLQLNWYW